EQREELELEISSSEELKALHAQFRQAKLTPDTGLQYLGAADLKRSLPLLGWTARRVIAAAAAVVILIGIASVLVFQTSGPVVRENFALNQAIQIKPDHILTAHEMPSLRPREIPPASDQPSERESLMIAKAAPVTGTKITDPVTLNHTPVILYARIPESNPYYPALNDAAPALANENKTLAGKVISGFFSKISAPFATDREKTADQNRKVTFWDLAELGVKSINVLGDHDYTLVREYNEKGNVKGVMLVEE
ncbi:MAG TPA: hypothetical protein VK994_05450, partial [Bacteroidales bacterium]|nr:hypothetical protein [Bacteroidales bacterium]